MKGNAIFQIIFVIVLSIGIALFADFLLIHFVVDVNPPQNSLEASHLEFYKQPHDQDIFIIGSSMVDSGIDAYQIDDSLQKKSINLSVYVLGKGGDTPLARVLELDNLTASRPKMVVIGISYRDLTNNTNIDTDRFAPISQRISCNKDCQSLFNDSQLRQIFQTPIEHNIYMRKFIFESVNSSVRENLFGDEKPAPANFKNPNVLPSRRKNYTEAEKSEQLMKDITSYTCPIFEDLNPQKRALQYTITKLYQNNISVIIINMPIDPINSNVINETTRHNLANFLNSTGVPWYNYERKYSSNFFADNQHMNSAGRTFFSHTVAEIIVEHQTNGA